MDNWIIWRSQIMLSFRLTHLLPEYSSHQDTRTWHTFQAYREKPLMSFGRKSNPTLIFGCPSAHNYFLVCSYKGMCSSKMLRILDLYWKCKPLQSCKPTKDFRNLPLIDICHLNSTPYIRWSQWHHHSFSQNSRWHSYCRYYRPSLALAQI